METTKNTNPENAGRISPYLRLEELVARLEALRASKVDFVADARSLLVGVGAEGLRLIPGDAQVSEFLPAEGQPMNKWARSQLAGRLAPECPPAYFEKLSTGWPMAAAQLAQETRPQRSRWFVRSLDGAVRAVLSDKYLAVDNYDIACSALDSAKQAKGEVIACTLDDSRMRLSITTRDVFDRLNDAERNQGRGSHLFTEITPKGTDDPGLCHPIVTVSNSETGQGGLTVQFGIMLARCSNTAIIERALDKVHLGSRMDNTYSSREQRKHQALALHYSVRDAIRAGLHPNTFARMVQQANQAQEDRIEAPSAAAANVLEFAGLFSESRLDQLLDHFRAYDSTRWGLSQAVSRLAQDVETAADVEALETCAGALVANKVKLTA